MIRLTTEKGRPTCIAEIGDRVAVYLDNWSVCHLASDETGLRERFVAAIRCRGTLLFSFANALEVPCADSVRSFLDKIGAEWVPLSGNPWRVVEGERAGLGARASLSQEFIEAYFRERAFELSSTGNALLDLSAENFFRLGAVANWAKQYRDIKGKNTEVDDQLRGLVDEKRAVLRATPQSLANQQPSMAFDFHRPATFVIDHLMYRLVVDRGFQFKKHDGIDFCHAVLGTAYAQIFTLDKGWAERVKQIPMPYQLAVYWEAEVPQFVERLEALVQQ